MMHRFVDNLTSNICSALHATLDAHDACWLLSLWWLDTSKHLDIIMIRVPVHFNNVEKYREKYADLPNLGTSLYFQSRIVRAN